MSLPIPHKAQFVLKLLNGAKKGKSIRLLSPEIKVGSSSSCDLILKAKSISPYHAHFRQTDSSYLLTSADSNNKILVNNVPIQSHVLKVKDQIQIGKLLMVFLEKKISAQVKPILPVKKKKLLSPPRILFGLIIVGACYFFLNQSPPENKEDESLYLKTEQDQLNQIENLNQQSEKELEEMTLDFKQKGARTAFIAGFRDYRKGYFKRALGYFKHCSTIDKKNELCRRYELKSESQIDRLIQKKIRIGNAYKDKKQYSACEATFKSVESMLEDSNSPIYKEAKAKRLSCSIHLRNKI